MYRVRVYQYPYLCIIQSLHSAIFWLFEFFQPTPSPARPAPGTQSMRGNLLTVLDEHFSRSSSRSRCDACSLDAHICIYVSLLMSLT